MARGFGVVWGTDTLDNVIFASSASAQSSTLTVSCWAYSESVDNGQGVWRTGTDNKLYMEIRSSGINLLRFNYSFTTTAGQWDTPSNSLAPLMGAWGHVAASYDNSNVANDPSIYVNGSLQSLSEKQTPVGTANPSASTWNIGRNGKTLEGMIAEFAVWNRILTTGEIAGLADGYTPLHYPYGLVVYAPLIRDVIDYYNNGAPTVTGALVQAHPPVIHLARRFVSPPTAIASSTVPPLSMYYFRQRRAG